MLLRAAALIALVLLAAAQVASAIGFAVLPPPAPNATGPSSTLDATLFVFEAPGAALGILLALVGGIIALARSLGPGRSRQAGIVAGSGVLALLGTFAAAWVLLSNRSPLHPFVFVAAVPLAVLLTAGRGRESAR